MSARGLRTVSLRRRVTAVTVAVFAVLLVGVMFAVSAAFSVIAARSTTAVLTDRVQLAEQLAGQGVEPAELVDRLETRSARVRLVLADGREFGSLNPARANAEQARTRRVDLARAGGQLAGAHLTIAVETRMLAGVRNQLRQALLIVAVTALILVAIATPLLVWRALAPLDAMTGLARQIVAGRRGERLAPRRVDTELGRTAAAFDEMLDALEGAESRARASEQSMRRFIADAAHELRTPITGVAAAAEAVLQQPESADAAGRQRLLTLAVREAQRAGRLVQDLLDMARIDSGLSLHPAVVDLRELAAIQVDRERMLYPEVEFRLDGAGTEVIADGQRIGQVIANLLDNAARVTPSGGGVTVMLRRGDGYVELAVADDGPGVPQGERERIFDRLVRLDESRDRGDSGAGLGLAIARGIARAHGGDVVCVATQGTGAVFVLRLPA